MSTKGGSASGGKKLILLNKKEGETPLESLEVFRRGNKEYKNTPMTYAGRLDPMASGLLLILAGEETKNKEKYLKLSKEYEFEILFGFATDTYDILGKVTKNQYIEKNKSDLDLIIKENLKYFTGKFQQKYPPYSSRTWERARAGEAIEAIVREVRVKQLRFLKLKTITSKQLLQNIHTRVKKVKGDFRQRDILNIWRQKLAKPNSKFFIASFKVKCSSGTYVRAIANSLGERIQIPALAFSIKRTKIGKWGRI